MNDYDTPNVGEVLQEETGIVAIPVRIADPVRVDRLPNELVSPTTVIVPPNRSVMLIQGDKRRARVTFLVINNDVMIDTRPIDKPGTGAYIPAGVPVPIHFEAHDKLYVRGVSLNVGGSEVQFGEATDTAVVSVIGERWSR
jgi:hypothetical protein